MNHETAVSMGGSETVSAYEGIGHDDLIGMFYETMGDPDIGRELSVRLFDHAGLAIDPTSVPLMGRDGLQVDKDGVGLTLADYINYAADHHFEAVGSILSFLSMKPGDADYQGIQVGIIARLQAGGEAS